MTEITAIYLDKTILPEDTRRRVEEGFETTKNELGLDHNESRSWHGWRRHVMRAYAVMTTVRYQANAIAPKKHRHDHRDADPVVGPGNQTSGTETRATS